jgi:hypothetical protein
LEEAVSKALAHQELVDELLRAWGSDIGSDSREVSKIDWPQHSILYRIIRDGPGASQNGAPPLDLTEMALLVDQAVAAVVRLGLAPQAKAIMERPAAAAAAGGALRLQGLMVGTAIYLPLQVQQFIMAAEVEV